MLKWNYPGNLEFELRSIWQVVQAGRCLKIAKADIGDTAMTKDASHVLAKAVVRVTVWTHAA